MINHIRDTSHLQPRERGVALLKCVTSASAGELLHPTLTERSSPFQLPMLLSLRLYVLSGFKLSTSCVSFLSSHHSFIRIALLLSVPNQV